MGKQGFKYVPLCIGIYLVLAAIEIFLFKPLINLVTTKFLYHVIIYNVFLLIANPIVTKLLVEKIFNKLFNNAALHVSHDKIEL